MLTTTAEGAPTTAAATERSPDPGRPWVLVATALAVLPVLVAGARALTRDWLPVGENGLYAVRARDVLTDANPLVGTAASGSAQGGTGGNQLGPLLFDALALPVRVLGDGPGLVVGVVAVNVLSIVGIAWFVRRRGDATLVVAALALVTLLLWSMGSEVLFEPWNPHVLLLPFLLFLICTWSVACGDLAALPVAALTGSLALQTHLSYALLVPALALLALAGLGLWLRTERARERPMGTERAGERPMGTERARERPMGTARGTPAWPALARRARRWALGAVVVLAACWLFPLYEQVAGDGGGNLSRLLEGSDGETTGLGLGAKVVATVVGLPPFWLPPSFGDSLLWLDGWRPPGALTAAAALVVVAGALVACALVNRRARDRTATYLVLVAAVALTAGVLTAARAPVSEVESFRVTPHVNRWLWPVGLLVWFTVVATLLRRVALPRAAGRWVTGALVAVAAVGAALALPTTNHGNGPNFREDAVPALHDLDRQLGGLREQGPFLVDGLYEAGFADPWSGGIVALLRARGIPFVVEDGTLVRQYGPERRYDGTNAVGALRVATGDKAAETPAGAERVALHEGLTAAEQEEVAALRSDLGEHLAAGEEQLSGAGRRALAAGDLPVLAGQLDRGAVDVEVLRLAGELGRLADDGLLADEPEADRAARYGELRREWARNTVAVFLSPLEA